MIRFEYDQRENVVTCSGHAGMAPKGQDIVCAGVSALIQALAQYSCVTTLEEGVRLQPGEGVHEWDVMAQLVETGVRCIVEEYRGRVMMTVGAGD